MLITICNNNNNKRKRIAYTINLIDTFPNAASNVLKIIFDFSAVRLCNVSESTCSDGKNIALHMYLCVF